MKRFKAFTKAVAGIGAFFSGLLVIPGVGDYLANGITVAFKYVAAGHPKLAIFSGVVALVAAALHNPNKPS
jgi:hypothetical protein